MKNLKTLLIVLIALVLLQCKTNEKVIKPRIETGRTLVLIFNLSQENGLILVSDTIYDEVLSTHTNNEDISAENRLRIIVKGVETLYIRHPLYQYVECIDDDYSFSVKEVKREKSVFEVRLPYVEAISTIEVQEILKNSKPKALNNFSINK